MENRVLVTGTSMGIGKAIAEEFLSMGFKVIGFDKEKSSINNPYYKHYIVDISKKETFPDLEESINYLVNNAGVQNSEDDILVNLKGTINITERYGIQQDIKAIVNISSASAHTGAEFPEYSASKGGMIAYTKNVALRIAKYGATCNSISPGGVLTDLNKHIIDNKDLWDKVMKETLIPKWATSEEIAEWVYFICILNKSMTAQDILIDNGEAAKSNFIW